jgi:hypothetical protein
VENADVVELDGKRYPVRITPRKGLRHVDFVFDGNDIRGLEQNPDTKSRWAMLARSGMGAEQMDDVLQCKHVPLAGIPRTQIRK